MEPIIINATDLRNKTRDLMERVKYHGDIYLVETFGRPMAVIMSVEEFDTLWKLVHPESSVSLPRTKARATLERMRKKHSSDASDDFEKKLSRNHQPKEKK